MVFTNDWELSVKKGIFCGHGDQKNTRVPQKRVFGSVMINFSGGGVFSMGSKKNLIAGEDRFVEQWKLTVQFRER